VPKDAEITAEIAHGALLAMLCDQKQCIEKDIENEEEDEDKILRFSPFCVFLLFLHILSCALMRTFMWKNIGLRTGARASCDQVQPVACRRARP